MAELNPYIEQLRPVFETITYKNSGSRFFSSRYDRALVEANIRKAFAEKRSFRTKEEVIPEEASLLNITNFTSKVYTEKPTEYYPEQEQVEKIIQADQGRMRIPEKAKDTIRLLEELGNAAIAEDLKKQPFKEDIKMAK